MPDLDPLFLSRIQFALTIGFHFIFPPLSIGLAWLLVWMEWKAWKGDADYAQAGKFYGKLLGMTFAMGVATGIVMEFQFGTNWSAYSKFVGDVFGAPLAAEAVFAFFLESTFLGLYLFGRNKVSKGVHWFSIFMVAIGATISAFWILVANSWQQTPAGFEIIATELGDKAKLTSFIEAVFNSSMWHRFFHTMLACLAAGGFLVMGIAAYHLRKGIQTEAAKKSLKVSLIMSVICAIALLVPSGHHHAQQVARDQPAKLAAMEGLVETEKGAGLAIFGIPQEDPLELKYAIRIPKMLSLLISNELDTEVKGMKELEAKWGYPPFALTFFSFHAMVGLGSAMIAITVLGIFLMIRKKLYNQKLFLRLLTWAIPIPILATQVGWIVAEVGRQPWVVYGHLKTQDAFSPNLSGEEVLFTIIMFSAIYLLLGVLYLFVMVKQVKKGPEPIAETEAK